METNSINSFLVLITGDIDNFMYTYILVALLVFTGIYFTIRTKGVQFRYIKDMFTQLFEKKVDKNGKAISSFQAMMVSTGSRVGTGNIAGIATALAMGGPGALFWMWVMALIGGASAFIESTLAQIFKIRGKDGQFRGGPAYYIQQGLGKRWMGIVFAVSLIACYVVGFNELQAYNAASGLEYYIPDYATNGAAVVLGVVFTIATAAVIFGGQKRISVINSWVVPIMALAYIGLGVWITFSHLNLLPAAFGMMFASAFDFQAIFGGFAGSALMLGIKRGLFSNEAGMGSAPNAAATASVSHPAKQGLVQTLSVYIDTLFICTCSAMIVLVFMVQEPHDLRYLHIRRTVFYAVVASRARYDRHRAKLLDRGCEGGILLGREGFICPVSLRVLFNLRDIRHTREHADHIREIPAETIGPFGLCRFRIRFLENMRCRLGKIAQAPATRGFHDDNRLAVLFGHFHEFLCLIMRILPVEVIDLELNEIHLGVRGQELIEAFPIIMYGKTNVLDLTCCFLFLREVPHIVFVELCGAFATDVVEQIVINIIKAHAFE